MTLDTIFIGLNSFASPLVQPLFIPLLYYTLQALGTNLAFWTKGDRVQDEKDFFNPLNPKPYDYIIVGAGSAGSLLANRLSRNYRVLLLEAGGEPNPLQLIPAFGLFLINYPEVDWMHRSVPQKYASLNSINQESSWSTGLGLGGTGNLNLMIHLRGHRRDFDNWATYLGDPSWSWEGVLPYFRNYEDYEIPGDNVNHGYRGDLRIEAPNEIGRAAEFVKACGELGYPHVDLNAPFVEGCDLIRYPVRNGIRQAPYKAFLQPIRTRSTLTIMKFAHVNKILFKHGNIAYGVEYDRHGRTYSVAATREVIISAGTVGTPKILMLSGVGPKPHLHEFNIPVISDLPVGQNLQDHLGVYLSPMFIRQGLGTYFDRDFTPSEFVKWFTLGRGVLSSTGCEAAGIVSSELAKERGEGHWPDITIFQYAFTNFRLGAQLISKSFNLKVDEITKYIENDIGKDSLYIAVQQSRPLSRGYIKLGGSSPYDRQIIDPNYLSDPHDIDLKVMLDGVKKALYLYENTTTGQTELGAKFTTTRLPGCEHLEFRSDPYWECFIRRYSVTLHHPVGTASMGTVVDTELRVIGTKNLRVVDASIQPFLVTTNTQASTLMIAEKAADMILTHWSNPQSHHKPIPLLPWDGLAALLNGNLLWQNKARDYEILNTTFLHAEDSTPEHTQIPQMPEELKKFIPEVKNISEELKKQIPETNEISEELEKHIPEVKIISEELEKPIPETNEISDESKKHIIEAKIISEELKKEIPEVNEISGELKKRIPEFKMMPDELNKFFPDFKEIPLPLPLPSQMVPQFEATPPNVMIKNYDKPRPITKTMTPPPPPYVKIIINVKTSEEQSDEKLHEKPRQYFESRIKDLLQVEMKPITTNTLQNEESSEDKEAGIPPSVRPTVAKLPPSANYSANSTELKDLFAFNQY